MVRLAEISFRTSKAPFYKIEKNNSPSKRLMIPIPAPMRCGRLYSFWFPLHCFDCKKETLDKR